jgi:hypothetical protein
MTLIVAGIPAAGPPIPAQGHDLDDDLSRPLFVLAAGLPERGSEVQRTGFVDL